MKVSIAESIRAKKEKQQSKKANKVESKKKKMPNGKKKQPDKKPTPVSKKMGTREIEELMGIRRPTYRRRHGAISQK